MCNHVSGNQSLHKKLTELALDQSRQGSITVEGWRARAQSGGEGQELPSLTLEPLPEKLPRLPVAHCALLVLGAAGFLAPGRLGFKE